LGQGLEAIGFVVVDKLLRLRVPFEGAIELFGHATHLQGRPKNPIATRSLGAIAPPRPKADAGMIVGTATAVPTAPPARRKKRRPVITFFLSMLVRIWAGPAVAVKRSRSAKGIPSYR